MFSDAGKHYPCRRQTMTESFGYSVKDTVITVPEFATAHERRALMGAADAAELTVLSLMDENTAAALQHGISQAYEEDTNVLFFNMGANSLKVLGASARSSSVVGFRRCSSVFAGPRWSLYIACVCGALAGHEWWLPLASCRKRVAISPIDEGSRRGSRCGRDDVRQRGSKTREECARWTVPRDA